MTRDARTKGMWIHRFAIRLFTLALAVLIFWVLGFLVQDLRSVRGPDYAEIERRHVDQAQAQRRESLDAQLAQVARQLENQAEKQRVVGDSSRNLQQTIGQLIELQKLGLEKSVAFSSAEQANFTSSLNLFLENQRKYQELSQAVSELVEKKQALGREREQAEQQMQAQRKPARAEFDRASQRHRLKLAFYQLAVLLPLLVAAALLIIKKRASLYFPLYLAFGAAALLKVGLVVHEYFPKQYFKYVLTGVLLLVVARLLVHFIRAIAFPKAQWLARQYREAYERFLCPVCEYPIRTGPRRFLFWTRRTVNKAVLPAGRADAEEPYVCPACGSALFEACAACGQVRHALLPHCAHCGAEKAAGAPAEG